MTRKGSSFRRPNDEVIEGDSVEGADEAFESVRKKRSVLDIVIVCLWFA